MESTTFDWSCKKTWSQSAKNTTWCLLGCSIGDFGTIFTFQMIEHSWPVWQVMTLAIMNGLLTSIALETIILSRQMSISLAFKTAIGMSFISMIAMEFAMNLTDDGMVGQQVFAGEATRLAYMTDEAKEGRDAFLEKRKPNFEKKWLP